MNYSFDKERKYQFFPGIPVPKQSATMRLYVCSNLISWMLHVYLLLSINSAVRLLLLFILCKLKTLKCQIGQPPLHVFDARNLIIQVFKFFPWLSKAGSVHCLMLTAGSMLSWIINACKLLLVSHCTWSGKSWFTASNTGKKPCGICLYLCHGRHGRHVKVVNPH